ncbi:hypothetical protein Bca101_025384 [Brassica carinata]
MKSPKMSKPDKNNIPIEREARSNIRAQTLATVSFLSNVLAGFGSSLFTFSSGFEIRLILTYLIRLDLVYFGSEAMVSSSSDLQYVCSPALFSLLPVPVCSGGSRPDSPETTFNAVLFGDIMARHVFHS